MLTSGNILACKLSSGILDAISGLDQGDLEQLCRDALIANDQKGLLEKQATKSALKKQENKVMDMISNFQAVATEAQLKNQQIRFGLADINLQAQKQNWPFQIANSRLNIFSNVMGAGNGGANSRDYEDVISPDILNAPICDVCIIQKKEPVPMDFYRISRSPGNKKANLNSGSGGNGLYLCIKKDLAGTEAPITLLTVFFPDRNEFVPPGFYPVRRGIHACNINSGTSADRIFLAYKREKLGNALVDLQIIFDEPPPKSFNLIEKSPTGVPADVNTGTGGPKIFLCYKQQLSRLQCLNNDPVVAADGKPLARKRLSLQPCAIPTPSTLAALSPPRNTRGRSNSGDATDSPGSPAPQSPNSASAAAAAAGAANSGFGRLKPVESLNSLNDTDGLADSEELQEDNEEAEDVLFVADMAITNRASQFVVDCEGRLAPRTSRKALLACLSALYVRQGSASEFALAGLMSLLKDSNFFENDLMHLPQPGTITMIDITVDAVCDKMDACTEAEHDSLLAFIRALIKHAGGRLASPSLQRIFRSFAYLVHYYSSRTFWMESGAQMPCAANGLDLTVFKVLKELIVSSAAQVEMNTSTSVRDFGDSWTEPLSNLESTPITAIMEDLAYTLVEDIVDSVDISRQSELALQVVSKQASNISSPIFWQNINGLSRSLFADHSFRVAFTTLCALCKTCWHDIRYTSRGGGGGGGAGGAGVGSQSSSSGTSGGNGPAGNCSVRTDLNARDLGSKLIALDALVEFCLGAGEKMKNSKTMGYQIRRLVVPCILFNMSYAFLDHRIFYKLLKVISALWKVWRTHIRMEFAILCEQIVIRVLHATQHQTQPVFQMIVLQEVVTWFDQPHLLIEMFVNYDMDQKFVSHWNVFSYLVRAVCTIARRTSLVTGAWDWRPGQEGDGETRQVSVGHREVHMQALEEVSRIAKTLMDATGHAHLIMLGTIKVTTENGWDSDRNNEPTSPEGKDKSGGVRARRKFHEQAEDLMKQADKIYKEKGSVHKAIKFLVSKSFMADTPQEIASFLRVYKNHFDPTSLGDFLGEGGITATEVEYWSQIRFRFVRAVSFVELDLEPALRLFLTNCGFRLPGEAQKIDRMVEVFVKVFWQDNHGTGHCPFRHPDTVHVVAFATIILNTDLHKASVDTRKGKQHKKMTRDEFINNLRDVDQGCSLDRDYVTRIYDSIQAHAIAMAFDAPVDSAAASSAASAVISNNPASKLTLEQCLAEEAAFAHNVARGLRDSEDLLRSLSPITHRFQLTGIDTNISLDLVSFMYETVWFHFHAITDALLTTISNDINVIFAALDILCYSMTSSIFLDLKTEKMAFAQQLMKFREVYEAGSTYGRQITDDSWFSDVENSVPETAMETIAKIHKLMVHLKDSVQQSVSYEKTRAVAGKIEKKAKVLEQNSYFVREGDLVKRSRTGRNSSYRFFLFSDYLIYAHFQTMSGEYKVHEQLSLSDMTVSTVDNDATGTSFYIGHPTKSFVTVAENPQLKQAWVHDIYQTITNCKKREALSSEGVSGPRRISMLTRIEDQQKEQLVRSRSSAGAGQGDKTPRVIVEDVIVSQRPFAALNEDDEHDSGDSSKSGTLKTLSSPASPLPLALSQPSAVAAQVPLEMSAEERAAHQDEKIRLFTARVNEIDSAQLLQLYTAGVTFWKGTSSYRPGSASPSTTASAATGGAHKPSSYFSPILQGLYELTLTGQTVPASPTSKSGNNSPAGSFFAGGEASQDEFEEKVLEGGNEGSMPPEEAKRVFLIALFKIAPYWKYEQFL